MSARHEIGAPFIVLTCTRVTKTSHDNPCRCRFLSTCSEERIQETQGGTSPEVRVPTGTRR